MFHSGAIPFARRIRLDHDVLVVEEPERVAEDWRYLEQNGHATAFQTRAWLEPWLRTIAPAAGARPIFVLARDRKSGEPHMLLPLCLRRIGRLDAIEFADLGVSDYNAPLLGPNFHQSRADFSALWARVRAMLPKSDLLRFDKSPAMIGAARNPLADLGGLRPLRLGAWSVPLPQSRELYESQALAPSLAKELRRKRRRIAQRGELRFFKATTREDTRRLFAALTEMRSARFDDLGRSNILADETCRRFYESLALDGANGCAELHGVEVDGVLVAVLFGLRHAGAYSLLLSGFLADEWKSCSLGNVSVDLMMSAAIDEGLDVFDFTIGDAACKGDFGAQRMTLYGGVQAQSMRALRRAAESRLKGAVRTLLAQSSFVRTRQSTAARSGG